VGKALGCGVDFSWREIEIVGRPKPSVRLSGRTLAFAEQRGLVVEDPSRNTPDALLALARELG
jgi:hypothetical protein